MKVILGQNFIYGTGETSGRRGEGRSGDDDYKGHQLLSFSVFKNKK